MAGELTLGMRVETPRGYGVIVDFVRWYTRYPGGQRRRVGSVLVELDQPGAAGGRATFRAHELKSAPLEGDYGHDREPEPDLLDALESFEALDDAVAPDSWRPL